MYFCELKKNVEKNTAKRSLAKLMLNALFGKLIQRERHTQYVVLQNPEDLQFYLNSNIHHILDIYCPNESYVVLTYTTVREIDDGRPIEITPVRPTSISRHICLTSGMQTTTTARLHLYKELEKLGSRCFYMDTDSLLYLETDNANEYRPKLSSAVGGLSNELEAYRKSSTFEPYIDEYVCIGPKSYA